MDDEEGYGDARNAVRREPFGGKPRVWHEAQAAAGQGGVECIEFGFDQTVPETESEFAETKLQEVGIVQTGPAVSVGDDAYLAAIRRRR